jgi:elongin-C
MTTNGDEAPASKYVTLISADGFEFVVLREATLISPTIKGMLRSPFAESKTGRCEFPEIKYVSIALPRLSHHFHGHDLSRDEISYLPLRPTDHVLETADWMSAIYT